MDNGKENGNYCNYIGVILGLYIGTTRRIDSFIPS